MDNNNDLMRLALISSEGQLKSTATSIIGMTKDVLADSTADGLNLSEICDAIRETYHIQFTTEEINEVLDKKRPKGIIYSRGKYCISIQDATKIRELRSNFDLRDCMQRFINLHTETGINLQELSELINKHIYVAYNSNKNMLIRLFHLAGIEEVDTSTVLFTNDEISIINLFISWKDEKKNLLLYSLISSGFDYCMITSRKDSKAFRHLLKGKAFYLDANIVFRLMGVNQSDRKAVTESFIERCRAEGIGIYVTNFTLQEIKDSIDSQVNRISKWLRKRRPLRPQIVADDDVINSDYYKLFYEWCKNNDFKDYEGFRDHLLRLFNDVIKKFKRVTIPSYEAGTTAEKFKAYCVQLKDRKSDRGKKFNELGIKCDVNNFMYHENDRIKRQYQNLWEANNYIITADNVYCDWARDTIPAVPIVVFPSVWHSILLKYTGRVSGDDYAAFSLFLSRRYSNKLKSDERIDRVIQKVLALPESTNIQEAILADIQAKLMSDYKDLDNIDEIVEKSQNSVVENIVSDNVSKIEKEKEQEMQTIRKHEATKSEKDKELWIKDFYRDRAVERAKSRAKKERIKYTKIQKGIYIIEVSVAVILAIIAVLEFLAGREISGIISILISVGGVVFASLFNMLNLKEKIAETNTSEYVDNLTEKFYEELLEEKEKKV